MTTRFHGQSTDLKENNVYGTFFANLSGGLVAARSRVPADPPSTDLSTADVDNGESLFYSVTCVTYVT
jgi:hypothetical protein